MGAVWRRNRAKRQYTILEDNDPIGCKASVTIAAKAEFKTKPFVFPTYFPDINPCDHALRVERCLSDQAAQKYESMQAFKLCLQKAALSIPCGGGHVARDRCTPVIASSQWPAAVAQRTKENKGCAAGWMGWTIWGKW